MRILVVDDDPAIRNVCSRTLRRAGHDIEVAATGNEAVGRAGEPFDIVLTDISLPGGIDGTEVTRRFRAGVYTDVLIMTGYPTIDTAIQGLRDGAYDYLIKPFDEEVLLLAIQRCVDKRRLSRELAHERALRRELDRAYTELSEVARIREIFGQFTTPEVARVVLADRGEFWRKGERKVLTTLFADVRGFTPFAARVRPEDATATLNEIFSALHDAIASENGILNKFIGDGMLALFGAPSPLEHHAPAAARAALKARSAVEALAALRERRGLEPLRIGLGINTGEVVAGCLGTRERTEYSVIGHVVNLASRLVDAAGPGEILLGPCTTELLRDTFVVRDRGVMAFKGIEPTSVVELVGPRGAFTPGGNDGNGAPG